MPAQFSLRAEGTDRLRAGLNRWMDTIAPISRDVLYAAMTEALKKSPGYLGGNSYTTPEAGYVRTGNLGRSVSIEQNGLTTTIRNEAYSTRGGYYGGAVLGDASGQRPNVYTRQGKLIDFSRWVTTRAAVDEQIDKLTQPGGDLQTALVDSGKAAIE